MAQGPSVSSTLPPLVPLRGSLRPSGQISQGRSRNSVCPVFSLPGPHPPRTPGAALAAASSARVKPVLRRFLRSARERQIRQETLPRRDRQPPAFFSSFFCLFKNRRNTNTGSGSRGRAGEGAGSNGEEGGLGVHLVDSSSAMPPGRPLT